MKISEHFDMEEFAVSAEHPELVVPVPAQYQPNVVTLVTTVLEPLRVELGRSIRILSGYRTAALNTAIGGSPTSQHRRAEAADLTTEHIRDVFRSLLGREQKLPSGQCILYPSRSFIHIALPSPKYPTPSFHIHEPTRGLHYQRVSSVGSLVSLLGDL